MSFRNNANIFKQENGDANEKNTKLEASHPYIKEILLHNDDTDQTFCFVATSVTLTLESSDNKLFSLKMNKEEGDLFSLKIDKNFNNFYLTNKPLTDAEKIGVINGWIFPVSVPVKICINGKSYDAWGSVGNSRRFNYELKIDKIDPSSIIDGCLHLSFNKGLTLKKNIQKLESDDNRNSMKLKN